MNRIKYLLQHLDVSCHFYMHELAQTSNTLRRIEPDEDGNIQPNVN